MVASPVFAASVTYQLSVTIPPHAMPSAQAITPGQDQALSNGIAQITGQQVIQRDQITRNDTALTVQSTVVL
jgi:hypothetical protein